MASNKSDVLRNQTKKVEEEKDYHQPLGLAQLDKVQGAGVATSAGDSLNFIRYSRR